MFREEEEEEEVVEEVGVGDVLCFLTAVLALFLLFGCCWFFSRFTHV